MRVCLICTLLFLAVTVLTGCRNDTRSASGKSVVSTTPKESEKWLLTDTASVARVNVTVWPEETGKTSLIASAVKRELRMFPDVEVTDVNPRYNISIMCAFLGNLGYVMDIEFIELPDTAFVQSAVRRCMKADSVAAPFLGAYASVAQMKKAFTTRNTMAGVDQDAKMIVAEFDQRCLESWRKGGINLITERMANPAGILPNWPYLSRLP